MGEINKLELELELEHFSRKNGKNVSLSPFSKSNQNILGCCWFSSLLREVFLRYSGFPLSSKTNTSKFQFDLESVPN